MVFMRLPVPHFHHVVAAGLILGFSGPASAQDTKNFTQDGTVAVIPVQDPMQQDVPRDESPFAQELPDDTPLDDAPLNGAPADETPEGGQPGADALAEPAQPEEATTAARLREREDLDLLFAELAQPEGESWSRAETDILRIWSRSGSAAMDMLYKRGEAALDAGDSASALGHLTALTDHAPDFAAGWYLRSVAFYLDGDFGPALADLEQVLALEPRHFAALTQLGTMLEEVGDRPRALQAYRESLKIHPHQQDAQDAVTRLEQETQGTDA